MNVICRFSLSVYPGDNLWDYFLREHCWPEKFRTFEIIFYKLVLAFMRACHECSFWRKWYTHKSLQVRFSCIFEKEIYLKIYIHSLKHSIDLFYTNIHKIRVTNCNFIKKWLEHRCISVNIAKFLKTYFFTEHIWWLLL